MWLPHRRGRYPHDAQTKWDWHPCPQWDSNSRSQRLIVPIRHYKNVILGHTMPGADFFKKNVWFWSNCEFTFVTGMRQGHMRTVWLQNILAIPHWCMQPTQAQMATCRACLHLRNCCPVSRRWSVRIMTSRVCWVRLAMVSGKCLQIWGQLLRKPWHQKCQLDRHTRQSHQTTMQNHWWMTSPLLVGVRAQH